MGSAYRVTHDLPEPCAVVIFGASGDLTHRKLIPALHNLHAEGRVHEGTSIIGTSRSEYTDEEFKETVREAIEKHCDAVLGTSLLEEMADFIGVAEGDGSDYARRTGEAFTDLLMEKQARRRKAAVDDPN